MKNTPPHPDSKTYKTGERVFIKPEFQDEGDDQYEWIVVESEVDGRVTIRPTITDLPYCPLQRVQRGAITRINKDAQ